MSVPHYINNKEIRIMKKNIKGFFVWMLMFVMVISGTTVVNKIAPQKAEAATTKCYDFYEDGDYHFSTKKRVKIGKYYYRVNEFGELQRSKSKNKNFKTIISDDDNDMECYNNVDFLVTEKQIYYTQFTSREVKGEQKVQTIICSCNLNGKSKKKILMANEDFELSTIYNNKIYVSRYSQVGTCMTWSISLKGEAKLKKVKKRLFLFNQRYGQYILGTEWFPQDESGYGACIYDVKKNKKISLGIGRACLIGEKIYYASYDANKQCYYIKKCNPDGSKKEVIAKLDSTIYYVTKVTKTYCEGYSTVEGSLNKVKITY